MLISGTRRATAHLQSVDRPIASVVKIAHLAVASTNVADWHVDPFVSLSDWNRWHMPGSDAGAHSKALVWAGLPDREAPDRTVTFERVLQAMMIFSDNAAADLAFAHLGEPAFQRNSALSGIPVATSFLEQSLGLMWLDDTSRNFLETNWGSASDPSALVGCYLNSDSARSSIRHSYDALLARASWSLLQLWTTYLPRIRLERVVAQLKALCTDEQTRPFVSLVPPVRVRLGQGAYGPLRGKFGSLPGIVAGAVVKMQGESPEAIGVFAFEDLPPDVFAEEQRTAALRSALASLVDGAPTPLATLLLSNSIAHAPLLERT